MFLDSHSCKNLYQNPAQVDFINNQFAGKFEAILINSGYSLLYNFMIIGF